MTSLKITKKLTGSLLVLCAAPAWAWCAWYGEIGTMWACLIIMFIGAGMAQEETP